MGMIPLFLNDLQRSFIINEIYRACYPFYFYFFFFQSNWHGLHGTKKQYRVGFETTNLDRKKKNAKHNNNKLEMGQKMVQFSVSWAKSKEIDRIIQFLKQTKKLTCLNAVTITRRKLLKVRN